MRRSHEASCASGPGARRLSRALVAVLVTVVGGICLAAGGSSSSSSTAASSSSASSSSSGSTVANACVKQVTGLISSEQAPMPMIVPSGKINMSDLKGKTVWFISPDQATGYALSVSQGFAAAGNAAGVKTVIFDGKGEPTLFTQGIDEAVAQHAGAIIDYAINPTLVPQALLAAKAAHIPVLLEFAGVPAPSNGTVFESINEDLSKQSDEMADYAAYATGCKVNGATSFDPLYAGLVAERTDIKAELAKLCPTTCSTQSAQMALATMATASAPAIQSVLQRNPNLNSIFATFDQAATYESPAVKSSGSSAKIIGTDGLPPNVDEVRSGGPQIADIAYVPPAYTGWLSLDQAARAIMGKPTGVNGAPIVLPVQILDKSNVGTSDALSSLFPKYAAYESAFKSLWGVG